jgi:hypothetical protein
MSARFCTQLSLGIVLAVAPIVVANDYVIFAPGLDKTETKALAEAISPGKPEEVATSDSLEAAARTDAKVLVIFADRKSMQTMEESAPEQSPRPKKVGAVLEGAAQRSELEPLHGKKVIGIGYGAAELFDRLGLEINDGACAHDPLNHEPAIEMQANRLCPNYAGKTLVAFRVTETENKGTMDVNYNFAMYLPRGDTDAKFVEAIARWQGDENYAPIVRQGSYVMIGLAAPPSTWTDEYKTFVRDFAAAVAAAPKEPFSRAEFEITKPGEYEFELAEGGSTTELARRMFYFRFAKPGDFSATLTPQDSNDVMLLLRGENNEHYTRQDGGAGKPLEINAKVSARDIQSVGQGYWRLDVTNFDRAKRAKCKLLIEY